MSKAKIIPLNEKDREFTGYFAGAIIQALAETEGQPVKRLETLNERLGQYIERLGPEALPKMVVANWLDFATTVIECLPDAEKAKVWEHLRVDPSAARELKAFLEPALAKLKYGWERMQNGGVPQLNAVA